MPLAGILSGREQQSNADIMMTAFTDTSSPELPYSLNVDHILSRLGLNHENRSKPFTAFWISIERCTFEDPRSKCDVKMHLAYITST